MRGLFRLPPSRSAQVRLSLPRSIPTCRFSQVLPSSPRKLVISCDFVGFRDFLGETWVLFSAILWGFRDFLGEPGCYFLRFCGFPGFPGRTWVLFSALLWGFRDFLGEPGCYFLRFLWVFRDFLGEPGCYFLRFCGVSGISWENLGGNSLGMGLGELQELVRGKVAGRWPAILTRNF